MTRNSWHIERDEDRLTLARHLPARFDFAVEARFPDVGRFKLAQQIRQDLWRALQNMRGYSPVVEVLRDEAGLLVRAGGQVDAKFSRSFAQARAHDVLTDAANHKRWVSHARQRMAA